MAVNKITNKQVVNKELVNRANEVSTKITTVRGNRETSIVPGNNISNNYSITLKDVDTSNPNYKETPKPKVEVSGNVKDDDSDLYGERKHTYTPEPNGNLQMEELMGKVLNKLDNIPGGSQTGVKAIEVDIKKEIAIGKADMSSIKSEEVKGKVNNKLDKLKKLRRRNGR